MRRTREKCRETDRRLCWFIYWPLHALPGLASGNDPVQSLLILSAHQFVPPEPDWAGNSGPA